jgi:uncharacterized protein YkwD
MKPIRFTLAVLASAALIACGGGGGGAPETGSTGAAQATQAAPAAASAEAGASEAAYGHFERLNEIRLAMGLQALNWNGSLAHAAQAHANYQSLNDVLGHGQASGVPGFTASGYGERASLAGYSGHLVGETIAGGQARSRDDGRRMMDMLLTAPGHRFVLLGMEFADVGIGSLPLTTSVGAKGNAWIAPDRLVAYPYNGQAQVPLSFAPASEAPNPLPGVALTGMPLSVHAGLFSSFIVHSAVLMNNETAQPVLLLPNPDIGQVRSAFIAYPAAALAAGTSYTFTLSATIAGQPRTVTTTFTSAS